jgi:hypothetical protein
MAIGSTQVTREQKINFIQVHRHGVASKLARPIAGLHAKPGRQAKPPSPEVLAAEAALEALPDEELDAQYSQAKEEAARELVERAAKQEAALPFNQPHARADFSHWAKFPYWEVYEAVALVLGKDPKVVTWESLRPYKTFPFVQNYDRVVDLAFRAISWSQLAKQSSPGAFLAWAKRYDIAVPKELESEAEKYGHFVGDWKTLFDKSQAQLVEVRARESALIKSTTETFAKYDTDLQSIRAQLELAVQAQSKGSAEPQAENPRELDSLRKLVIGMAIKGYSYDPNAKRSDKIAEVVDDLERLGIPLHRDTVRKFLKEAADLLPQDALKTGNE